MPVKTINDIYLRTSGIERASIMKYKKDEKWIDIGVEEFSETVRHLSTGLRMLGVKREDRVAILSENRPEWTIADFAIMAAGAVSVTTRMPSIARASSSGSSPVSRTSESRSAS